MHLGCIAIGEIHCDGCGRAVKHPNRYLAIYDEEGIEPKKVVRYCADCALSRGYAHYRIEKGEQVLTFFPE
jgi:uncharacterized Zn-finger protein